MNAELPVKPETVFRAFLQKREQLNACLAESQKEIDTYLAQLPLPAPLNALANLEGLLTKRRNSLAELVALDEEFMKHSPNAGG